VCRAGAEERSKGAAREIATNQQDRRTDLEVCRAWTICCFVFLRWDHYPRKGAQINNNKSHRIGFPFGVFPGVIYLEISCAMCVVSFYFLPMYVSLNKTNCPQKFGQIWVLYKLFISPSVSSHDSFFHLMRYSMMGLE
jgi:hypothetical protein